MVSYQIKLPIGTVIISLEVDDPNTPVALNYSGEPQAIALVQEVLQSSCGLYGHLIGDRTTAIDLDAAINSQAMNQFQPDLIEGREIIEAYTPESFPEGMVS